MVAEVQPMRVEEQLTAWRARLLPAALEPLSDGAWLWCVRCERASRLDDDSLFGGVACKYADCAGQAPDLWQWENYRAWVGGAPPAPDAGARYPLIRVA